MEVRTCRWRYLAVLTVFLFTIASLEAKPLQADLSSLSSQELQYYFGRNSGVPEYRLLNTNHLRRERRSTDGSTTLRYNLDAFDESFQLMLQQTKNLFNAGTLIHRIDSTGVPKISSPERHCYFTGVSENHADSRVFVSTCNGLFGSILIDSAEYVIQPLKDEHIDQEDDLAPNHIIFKKPDVDSSSSCSNHEAKPTEDTTSNRRRRDVSDEPKYLETSVVVDDAMHSTYGESTENYVLSILNQVSGLLRDVSLDATIALHINKITILEEPQKNLDLTNELDHSLNNFCDWQNGENTDVSLLITKRDLEVAGNKEVTGKASDVGGACNPNSRCIITEDHGPSGLVFTVAHELGHSMGMYHDGILSGCTDRKNIMASINSGGSDAFSWSKCSNDDLNSFLSTTDSACLDNAPLGLPEYDISQAPMAGYHYNATKQCQLTFGPYAKVAVEYAETKELCKALRCDISDWVTSVSNDVPPLDGTSCGTSRRDVCMRGTCMKVYSKMDCSAQTPNECPAEWLEGAWESCNDCLQIRTVLCVVQIPDGTTRLADESQCANEKPAIQRNCCTTDRFQFVSGPFGSCSTTCDNGFQTRTVVCQDTSSGNTVADSMCIGVRPATTQPCFVQACEVVSSFNYVISPFGECSVTCGTGIESRTVQCVNANSIVVSTSNCVDAGLGVVPTTQVCNTLITCPSEVIYRYVTGPLTPCSVTCGTGIQTRIVMCMNNNNIIVAETFCQQQNLVRPDEAVPCFLDACPLTNFRYITGSFGQCSVTCGSGVQTRTVTCVDDNSNVTPEADCINNSIPKPSTTQGCELDPCPQTVFAFVVGNYGQCSVTCGAGVRTRSVFCVNQDSLSFPFQTCLNAGLEQPTATTECVEDPCPGEIVFRYDAGAFLECSVTCGEGVELRVVTCVDQDDNVVDEGFCVAADLTRPDNVRVCFPRECPTFSFFTGEFGPCSVSCGEGIQVRVVECRDENGNVVGDDFCGIVNKPTNLQICTLASCDLTFEYVTGPFGTCSCDAIQTRIVLCVERSGVELNNVAEAACVAAGLTRPASSQVCTPPPSCAGPSWATTDWGACSVTCDIGVESRLVFCVEAPGSQVIVDDSLCNLDLKPDAARPCETGVECPNQYIWLFNDFSECSVTCGEGVETREVTCYSLANSVVSEVDPSLCPADDEPPAVRECSRPPCNGAWQAAAWSACSQACGCGGTRTRMVGCYTFKGSGIRINNTECIEQDRPDNTEGCYEGECLSPYGCDQSYEADTGTTYQLRSPNYPNNYPNDLVCSRDYVASLGIRAPAVEEEGEGRRRRQAELSYHVEITFTFFDIEPSVNCQFDYLEILDIQGTNSVKLCGTLDPLPYVYKSVGPEVDVVFVSDASNNAGGFDATYEIVPNEGAYYVTGDFGVCSVTCGEGMQSRTVTCYLNSVPVDESECASLDKPPTTRPCNVAACPGNDACAGGVVRTEPGQIQSPNFPSNYTVNATCVHRVVAPLGKVIRFETQFFQVRDSTNCMDDALLIQDANNVNDEPLRFCGNIDTATVLFLTQSNEALVTFLTYLTTTDLGFSVTYSFVDPILDVCDSIIQTNNQPIYSPGFPGNYSNDEFCQVSIISPSGCVELRFLDIELQDECQDIIQVNDQNSDIVDRVLCGNTPVPPVWRSASNFVRVSFSSDSDIVNSGYLAVVSFDECYVGTYDIGEWSECPVTCGEGSETRTVQCIHATTGASVSEDLCPEQKPDDSRPCVLAECPSCDRLVTQSGNVILYPTAGGLYGNNENCVTTINNPSGCISLIFLDVDIQPGSTPQFCDRDYLEVIDSGNSALTFRVCGDSRPANFQSTSGVVQLHFVSDSIVTASGYQVFPNFGACPDYAFIPEDWSQCDQTCGIGMRSREVPCIAIAGGIEVNDNLCPGDKPAETEACALPACPSCDEFYELGSSGTLVQSENYPANYSANLDCTYFLNNTETNSETCIQLQFLGVDLDQPNEDGICEDDYLEAVDVNFPALTRRYCGDIENAPEMLSRSREVEIRFRSNDAGTGSGFIVYSSAAACSPFGYVTGEFGECDVTCDGGVRTRSVQCVTLSNNNPVTEDLCANPKPHATEPCGGEECPSCDAVVGNQDIFQSPNYPMDYGPRSDCEYTISNPNGCISLLFLAISLEAADPQTGDCKDYVEIRDDSTDLLTTQYCGSVIPNIWRSRSSDVTVRFYSDAENEDLGFSMYPQFVSCPPFGWVTQDFGECSVTCGEGIRLRQVMCINLSSDQGMVVLDSLCTDVKPPTSEPCTQVACPTCDRTVNTTGVVNSPNNPVMPYENNQECVYTVVSLDPQECVRLYFIQFELPEPVDGVCTDYVRIEEIIPGPLTRDAVFCGTQLNLLQYETLSSQIEVTFVSDGQVVAPGFQMYTNFQDCPRFAYAATEWDECSTTCGEGLQTRNVGCYDFNTMQTTGGGDVPCSGQTELTAERACFGPPCPLCYFEVTGTTEIFSPGFPEGYLDNQNCVYNITNSADNGCIELRFLYFDLRDRDQGACTDFLTVDDVNDNDPEPQEFCDNENPEIWNSQSGNVVLNFVSDGSGSAGGFTILTVFESCPEPPPFVYELGEYGECDVTCGEGTQARTVKCVQRTNPSNEVSLGLCIQPPPPAQRVCSEEPCPSCDQFITASGTFAASPNNPLPYENNQLCVYNITDPEDNNCINIIFLSLELESGSNGECQNDFLRIEDGEVDSVTTTYCGVQAGIPEWKSRSSSALMTFSSNDAVVLNGFNVYVTFVTCPIFGFVTSEWTECDAGCDGGEQTRTVSCQRLETGDVVDDDICSDAKPATVQACNTEPCPSCDETLDQDRYTLNSPDSPNPYGNNYNCDYTYTNPNGQCMVLFFLNLDLPAANEFGICDQDYLLVEDLSANPVSFTYCGDETPPQFQSRSSVAKVTFVSDNNDTVEYDGFSIYSTFSSCPLFGFTVGEYGACDRQCGGGMQTRTVQCVLFSTMATVSESTCTDPKPEGTRSCNTDPCPSCDQVVTQTNQVIDSPNPYEPQRTCTYTITNPDDCVTLTFLSFKVPQGADDTMCTTDYVKVSDLDVDYLDQTYCGYETESFNWQSRTGDVEVTFQSGPVVPMDATFQIYVNFDNCPTVGYVAGAFGDCSQTCGTGFRTRTVECQILQSGTVLDDSSCANDKPATTEVCQDVGCPSCDADYDAQELVRSLNPYGPNRRCVYTVTNPSESGCINLITVLLELDEPNVNDTCDVTSVTYQDTTNPDLYVTYCGTRLSNNLPPGWTSISNSVQIIFETGPDANQTGDNGFETFPQFVTCPNYGFVAGAFQMCSASCEGGTQIRAVECQNLDTNAVVDDAFCGGVKPDESRVCNTGACPEECNILYTSAGDDTLRSPGYGYTYPNDQECINTILNTGGCIILTFLDLGIQDGTTPYDCDRDYVELIDANHAEHSRKYCGSTTPTGTWRSESSLARVKFVSDGSVTDTGYEIFPTFTSSCPTGTYTVGAFGDCSTTCGSGTQFRSVSCRINNVVVANNNCPGATPDLSQPCSLDPCADWVVGDWSDCTAICDTGTRSRSVSCQADGQAVDDAECTNMRPEEVEACNTDPCATLTVGNWTECSTTCGDGIETRVLTCEADNVAVDVSLCPDAADTDTTRVCNLLQCPVFVTGPWSECPATCGDNNTQTRNVTCENDVMDFDDSACTGVKPDEAQTGCNSRTCGVICGDLVDVEVTSTGSITMPTPFTGLYDDTENCTITFVAPANFIINIDFVSLDISTAANPAECLQFDYIEWTTSGTSSQKCDSTDLSSLNSNINAAATSTHTFSLITNNDGNAGAGVSITFSAFNTGCKYLTNNLWLINCYQATINTEDRHCIINFEKISC